MLSSDDPVRVFQEFAEVDLISGGRAEIMAGRGSFIESFPLFGYDLDDYDDLFAEKLELLLKIRDSVRVSWSGRHRPALDDVVVWPRPSRIRCRSGLPWAAHAGSVVRAGTLGLPLTVAIIGGTVDRFVPLVQLYRESAGQAGHAADALPVAINTHAFVGETLEQADSAFAAPYLQMMNRIGRERGWPPSGRREYEGLRSPRGALAVGTPRAGGREDPARARAVREHALHRADERRRGRPRRRAALDGAVRHARRAARPRGSRAPQA